MDLNLAKTIKIMGYKSDGFGVFGLKLKFSFFEIVRNSFKTIL